MTLEALVADPAALDAVAADVAAAAVQAGRPVPDLGAGLTPDGLTERLQASSLALADAATACHDAATAALVAAMEGMEL